VVQQPELLILTAGLHSNPLHGGLFCDLGRVGSARPVCLAESGRRSDCKILALNGAKKGAGGGRKDPVLRRAIGVQ